MKCFLSITLQLDMNECKGSNNVCDLNADCTNTEGSHNCTCKEGYIGDGKSCQGTKQYLWIQQMAQNNQKCLPNLIICDSFDFPLH